MDEHPIEQSLLRISLVTVAPSKKYVTDDLGRAEEDTLSFNVNQGIGLPILGVANDQVTVMSNEPIDLDARQSFEPNSDCDDRIVAYEWDLLADGQTLNGQAGADFNGAQVQIHSGLA